MVSVVASLSKSFDQVPPSAVPAVLDCILVSTGLSPPSLLASLIDHFPRFLKVPFIFIYQFSSTLRFFSYLILLLVDLHVSRTSRIVFFYYLFINFILSFFFLFICLIIFVECNLQDIIKEDGSLDSDKQHRLVSLVGAFCHLLKKTGQFPFDLCALFGLVTVVFSRASNLYLLVYSVF